MSRDGLVAMLGSFGAGAACVAATYAHPACASLRPWSPGDPLPVIAALTPRQAPRVVESAGGELVEALPLTDTVVAAAASEPAVVASIGVTLPARPPGVATPLVDAGDRGMDPFYRALHRAQAGQGLARASQWGDSTIAADGITSTVRARLQSRFGNGGPGYLSAGMDPRWNIRKDVTVGRHGDWETASLLGGGGGGRYGFGGIVSTATTDAWLGLGAPKVGDGKLPLHRLEVWYQAGPERGGWWASADGKGVGQGSAAAENPGDRWHDVDVPDGYTRAAIGAAGGPVPFYGVVMETKGPGVVWDALGVVGVGSRSFTQHSKKHLANQVAHRRPDLVVVMLGGNELGFPVLAQGDGAGYLPHYQDAVRRLRAGAPTSGCLVVPPVDQGKRDGGAPRTHPNLERLVAVQKRAAAEEGCAFWDAWGAMGGAGSIVRWSMLKPPLAWTDLMHLSTAGQDIVGNLLADAIEAGYDGWVASGGASRPAPTPPGPPAPVTP